MNNKDQKIHDEARSLTDHMSSMPGLGHGTCTKSVLRKILLDTGGGMMLAGYFYDITSKHLGAGVYRVTTVRQSDA
jgi:hypothetical protein